ncbi:MAG: zinc ABC transporter ATP-binding protein AztA [Acidimicrobiales bacterium]
MSLAIEVDKLEVRYDDRVALGDVTMSLDAGSSLAIIGPNGSGKSTLLAAIAGLAKPSRGAVSTFGVSPAFVLQSTEVDRSLPITVRDTVGLARYPSLGLLRRFGARDRQAVADALERLDIADLADRQIHELSGGQRQRVLVAQGLAQESPILLLDEPITALDIGSRAIILDVMSEERAAGRTVLMTTHDLDDARRCQFVLLLRTTPVAYGTPAEVLTEAHLARAFGGHFVRVGDRLLLDDPHHHHHHH